MTRVLVLSAALGLAPMQCGSGNTDDTHYETPPEAIYELSQHFKKAGNQAAYRETLDYLIDHYPNSRFAVRAKNERQGASAPPAEAESAKTESP